MTTHTEPLEVKGLHILAVIVGPDGKPEKTYETHNMIGDAGEIHYAQRIVGETPDDDFESGYLVLGEGESVQPTPTDTDVNDRIDGSQKAVATGYPKRNDDDPNNTYADVNIITWKYVYDADTFSPTQTITEGAIVDNYTTPTAALTHFVFSEPFTVPAGRALHVFVNHGVFGYER